MAQKYPHLLPGEVKLWELFLKDHGGKYYKFEYDIHVGKLAPELEKLAPKWRRGAESLFLKRIDVVGWSKGTITIFEVKPYVGLGALGQILGYMDLYEDKFSPREDLQGVIIARFIDITTRHLFDERHIDMYVYPDEIHPPS